MGRLDLFQVDHIVKQWKIEAAFEGEAHAYAKKGDDVPPGVYRRIVRETYAGRHSNHRP